MKKYLLLLVPSALILGACSQETNFSSDLALGEKTTVSFSVNLPDDLATRSIGDGSQASQLQALVYYANTDETTSQTTYDYIFTGEAEFKNGSATVEMDLLTGKNYEIVLFAASQTALTTAQGATGPVYSLSTEDATLSVNYQAMTSEGNLADAYDCFYQKVPLQNVSSTSSQPVELTRPVAQVNWGTSDLSSTNSNVGNVFGTNGAYIQTVLTTTPYISVNLLNGTGTLAEDEMDFPAFAIPTGASYPEVAGSNYAYVGYQYLLMPTTQALMDLTLSISNTGAPSELDIPEETIIVPVDNAPLQANYQTNIYGALLTATNSFNVTKGTWSGSNPVSMATWDGSVTYPTIPEDTETPIMINQPSDLAGLAKMVNGTASDGEPANDFSDYTIALAADFDMGGNPFEGIGSVTRSGSGTADGSNSFRGTFDGKGHTISNLTINLPVGGTEKSAVGFIGNLDGTESALQNVTFDNLQINGGIAEQAGVVGLVTNGATVRNVTVTSGSVSSAEAAGAIVGRLTLNGTITECNNGADVYSSKWNVGGIVGAAYYTEPGSNMTISNCKNSGAISGVYAVGGIAGLGCADISGCENTGSITGTSASVGGIVGEQKSAGSIKGCTNSGTVIGGSATNNYGAGGIVGWVRYQNDSNYARQNIIEVSSNTNTASVSGQIGAGGIVGVWFQCGICYSNKNMAPSLSANSFVAGIVGNSQWVANETIKDNITTTLDNVTGNVNMLYVDNNYSETTKENMTGGLQANYVYVNTPAKTTVAGNSQTDQNVVGNEFNPNATAETSPNTPAN